MGVKVGLAVLKIGSYPRFGPGKQPSGLEFVVIDPQNLVKRDKLYCGNIAISVI